LRKRQKSVFASGVDLLCRDKALRRDKLGFPINGIGTGKIGFVWVRFGFVLGSFLAFDKNVDFA
jgi:hypothetical protein